MQCEKINNWIRKWIRNSCCLVVKLCPTLWQPHVTCQAPLFMGFPGQEYQSGLPFPSPRDLPDPGVKPVSPALAGRFFATEPRGKPSTLLNNVKLFFKVVVPTTAATRVMMFQFCILTILSLICRLDALGMLSHALFYYAFL